MRIEETALDGVLVLTPARYRDHRGVFSESWNKERLEQNGIRIDFVQDNLSLSDFSGTVRGLHFQAPPFAQDKLVRCARGAIFDVAVDIRRGSPSYGHWVGEELSFENGRQLLVPAGFAHGFMTLTPGAEVSYKCSDVYAPQAEGVLAWDDPILGIDWPEPWEPILSDRDRAGQSFATFLSPFLMESVA